MKINQVAELVDITKKNIRFYEYQYKKKFFHRFRIFGFSLQIVKIRKECGFWNVELGIIRTLCDVELLN